jgi:hypothetical protein
MKKAYFSDVKEGEEVFGLIFGHGKVPTVFGDGHYTFEVMYDNDYTVPYTEDGIPGWSNRVDGQTVFYKSDIDLMELDFSPSEEVLTPKKIIKLRVKNKLEIKCPSGIWQDVRNCPSYIMEDYLENGKLHLFRKTPEVK